MTNQQFRKGLREDAAHVARLSLLPEEKREALRALYAPGSETISDAERERQITELLGIGKPHVVGEE
jgi:hypothetical protein